MATNAPTAASQAAANKLAGMKPPSAAPAPAPAAPEVSEVKGKKGKDSGEEGGKKKLPIKPIALVLVVLLVGYVAKGKIVKPHYGPGHPVPMGAIYDFPSAVTTNLPDGSLAQVGISLQLTKVASSKTVTKDTSELVGLAVQDIGSQTYATLISVPGRVALQAALLKSFQGVLGTSEGAQQVVKVFFTSYVLQQQ